MLLYFDEPGELKAGLWLGLQLRYRFFGDDPIPDLIGVMPAKEGFLFLRRRVFHKCLVVYSN